MWIPVVLHVACTACELQTCGLCAREVVSEFLCVCSGVWAWRNLSLSEARLLRIPMTLGRIMIPLSAEITLVGERMDEKCPQEWRKELDWLSRGWAGVGETGRNTWLKLKISVTKREQSRGGKGTAQPRGVQEGRVIGSGSKKPQEGRWCWWRNVQRWSPGRGRGRHGGPHSAARTEIAHGSHE